MLSSMLARRLIQTSSKIEGKPNAYIVIMSSRTLSADNVKRMRRFVSDFKKWRIGEEAILVGMLTMTTKAWVESTKMKAYQLSNSKSVQSWIYRNFQAYRQQNRILARRERQEGRPCGVKMS